MTRINPDDPKWTAYILGELSEAERAEAESELESSEEARMLVEELRFAAELTKMELAEGMSIAPLTSEQREAIHASANVLRPRRWFGVRPAVWAAGLAAASVALMVALSPMLLRSPRRQYSASPPAIAELRKADEPASAANEQAKSAGEFELRYEHPVAVPAPARSETAAPHETAVPEAAALRETVTLQAPAPAVAEAPAAAIPALELKQAVPTTAQVVGRVQDTTNAVIPGVTVVATNTQTGAVASSVTDATGGYTLDGLPPGTYRVTGSLPGFQTSVVDNIQVAANTQAERNITLNVAATSSSVEVAVAADTVLSTSSASVGQVRTAGRLAPGTGGGRGGGARPAALGGAGQALVETASSPALRAPGVPPAFDRIAPSAFNNVGKDAESYDAITDNPFLAVGQNPLSTFSIDVDTASYANVRRYLNQNQMPPRDAVRIEEMVNYFTYDYPQPSGNNPIGATVEAASAPWNPQHRLVRIGIKAKDIDVQRRPPSNLVFLLDVSGSMEPPERLPLLKDGIHMLVEQLTSNDRVTVVTYAGTTGVALRSTHGDQKDKILRLIDSLQAGGSTNGGSGIQLAYDQAVANFIPGGVNRVILATDGDFNVGITDRNALLRLIEQKAKSGVFLSVLGVGMGNYKDSTLEMLADKGHGNYAYLDTLNEARKVLVDQMSQTFITVAKDVKVQVEFNPAIVDAYRLIGYENRALRNEDFNNDLKDAGDMGTGHTVTALYEVVPHGVGIDAPAVDSLKYQQPAAPPARDASNETLTVKIRYKEPTGTDSKLLVFPLVDREQTFARSAGDFRFAAAVASFGMILRDSPFKGTSTLDSVIGIAEDSMGSDRNGYRREFLQLVQRRRQIRNGKD